MTIWQTFNQGLVITGLGMGLVFLTLVVVMYSIKALDLVFKFKPEAVEAEAAEAVLEETRAADVAIEPVATDLAAAEAAAGAEAAAIAVAIALARQARPVAGAPAPSGAYAPAGAVAYGPRPAPLWMKPLPEGEDEIVGEVVTVLDLDAGPGTWKGHGREQALQ